MRHPPLAPAALALTLALTACADTGPAGQAAPLFPTTASIQDLMVSVIDPSADILWEAVSSETSQSGTVENAPRDERQWQAVRNHAITLIEGANLLSITSRAVTHHDNKLEDAHVEGISTVADIRRAIDADPARFQARARELHDAGKLALAAIDARDAARLQAAGMTIDHACESCHVNYWYPNTAKVPVVRP